MFSAFLNHLRYAYNLPFGNIGFVSLAIIEILTASAPCMNGFAFSIIVSFWRVVFGSIASATRVRVAVAAGRKVVVVGAV